MRCAAASSNGSRPTACSPEITGEFEDNALLNTFGRSGLGLFFAPAAMAREVKEQLGALPVGIIAQLREPVYAISSERKIRHPAVAAILEAPHGGLFAPPGRG